MIFVARFRQRTLALFGGPWRPFPGNDSVKSGQHARFRGAHVRSRRLCRRGRICCSGREPTDALS
eukprot:4500101-Alexandrium_andersonii.AAC.1